MATKLSSSSIQNLSESSDKLNHAVSQVLNSIYILPQILANISPEDFKQCRLVNRFWNITSSSMYFKTHAVLKFKANQRDNSDSDSSNPELMQPDWGNDLNGKLLLLQNFKIRALHIDLSKYLNPYSEPMLCDIMGSLKEYYGSDLEYLMLSMNLNRFHEQSALLLRPILLQQQFPFLYEIVLDLKIEDYLRVDLLSPPLYSVRSVRLLSDCFIMRSMTPLRWNVGRVMRLFPNAESIASENLFITYVILYRHIYATIATNPIQCLKKMDIKLKCCTNNWHNLEILSMLAVMQNGLEGLKLEITSFPRNGGEMLSRLVTMLQRHAQKLRSLCLIISYESGNDKIKLNFPSFPQLRRLDMELKEQVRRTGKLATFGFRFPSGQICYAQDFPKLQDLTIHQKLLDYKTSLPDEDDAISGFLPFYKDSNNNTCCVTMRRVDIFIPREWMVPWNLSWGQTFWGRFQKVFPNNKSWMSMQEMINWIEEGKGIYGAWLKIKWLCLAIYNMILDRFF